MSEFASVYGPFHGVSCRGSSPESVRAPFAVNVDTSKNTLKCRPGYSVLRHVRNKRLLGVHGHTMRDGTPVILAVFWNDTDHRTEWAVYDLAGTNVTYNGVSPGDPISLNEIPHAWLPDPYGFVHFVEWNRSAFMVGPRGCIMRFTSTDSTEYPWGEYNPRPADVGETLNDINLPYLLTFPRAKVLGVSGSRVILGDFDNANWLPTHIEIPAIGLQNVIPDELVSAERDSVSYAQHQVLISDPNTIAFAASSYLSFLDSTNVRAVCEYQRQLLVWTERSLYVVSRAGMQYSQDRLTDGSGCVSQRTVVQARGIVAWMAPDGFYAFQGGGVQKISGDISDMWGPQGFTPTPMTYFGALASDSGWPWKIATGLAEQACGVFDEVGERLLWSVPILAPSPTGSSNALHRLILVWYPSTNHWDIWTGLTGSGFQPTCFTRVFDGTKWRLVFGTETGQICFFGEHNTDWDNGVSLAEVPISWGWQSPPAQKSPAKQHVPMSVRVRQRANQSTPSDPLNIPKVIVETERTFDATTQSDLQVVTPMVRSTVTGPPQASDPTHVFDTAVFGTHRWHVPSTWTAKYATSMANRGNIFSVGFFEQAEIPGGLEIYDYHLELDDARADIP